MQAGRTKTATLVLGAALVAVLIAHAASYLPFVADDALISLRYAERFLDGHGLTWTDGQRLEGYSNLLWILACAALGAVGVDLIVATRVLGILFSVLAVMAVVRAYPPRSNAGALPAAAGGGALVLSGSIAVWAVGGLEQSLVAALLAWGLVLCYPLLDGSDGGSWRQVLWPAIPFALLCWTRPDGALFTVGTVLGLAAARGWSARTVGLGARLAIVPFLAVCAQVAFRMAYYGESVPNSAHAKLAMTWTRVGDGLTYLGMAALFHAALVIPAALLAWRSRNARIRFLCAPLVVWSAYVVIIGGDIFPGRRHFVPVVVILALMLASGVESWLGRRGGTDRRAWALAGALATLFLAAQRSDPENLRARTERWEWDGQVTGNLLRESFGDRRPLLAADPAGTLPYFSKLPAIDMLGINDRHIARHRPDGFGHGFLGHELGDGAYVLDREPDLVVFCLPSGSARPCFRSGQEMVEDPRFREGYRLVTFEGDDPYRFASEIWVRAEGGRIGVQRNAGRVQVPGFLFMATGTSVARRDDDGRLGVDVTAADPAGYAGLVVPPGKWTVTVEPPDDGVWLMARLAGSDQLLARGRPGMALEVPEGGSGTIDVLVSADTETGSVHVAEVILENVDGR